MKKTIYILIAIIIVIILAGVFKFDILSNFSGYDVDGNKITNNTEKNIAKNYYNNLRKECKKKTSESCCLASVDRMEELGVKLVADNKCKEGYKKEMMKCVDSFAWCQKVDEQKEVKDFDSCVKASGEVDPEYPNECLYQGDMVFTKENQNPDVKTFKACQEKGGKVEEIDNDQRCSLDGLTYFFKSEDGFEEAYEPKPFNKNDKELVERLKKIKIVIEKNDDGKEESVFPGYLNLDGKWPVKKWVYSDDINNKKYEFAPIQPLTVDDRKYFAYDMIGKDKQPTKENIMKRFPGLKSEDFKYTGDLKYQVDFDILLNNYLIRSGLEPQNGEHLEEIIKELQNK